jgi:hydrogenase maturation protein HypF
VEGRAMRVLIAGEVQDSPFEGALARALQGRPGVLRRVGAGLELKVACRAGETPSSAARVLKSAVARASRASGAPARVVASGMVEGGAFGQAGIRFAPPSWGSSDARRAEPCVRTDLATCADCARELERPGRRHGYLRTECSACGPRYSHAVGFPLARDRYGLGSMPPCAACRAEAGDPGSRRFGSERISCGECGPTATLLSPSGSPSVKAALRRAADRMRGGGVVAVQTPYGFLGVVTPAHIAALRVEIGNEFVPLTLVVPTPAAARGFVHLSAAETRALFSPRSPQLLVAGLERKHALVRELAVFGDSVSLRAPDCPALLLLTAAVGAVAAAPASRGGQLSPAQAKGPGGLPGADWLSDGPGQGDPVAPSRGFHAGARFVLLAHGRGSLPARLASGGAATALAFGGGTELFGAAAFGGFAYLTGSAGPAKRGDTVPRLRRLLSRAAALSPAASADTLDFVVSDPEEGSPGRLAAEETAAEAGCQIRTVTAAVARAACAQLAPARPARAALVLGAEEMAGEPDLWLSTDRTGGEVIDVTARRVQGGIAPFEVVESPGGRSDTLAPLASLFERVGLPLDGATSDDSPILEVLRARALRSTSFVALVDAVASALGLVPRRAPAGSGLAEIAPHALRPSHGRRFRFAPHLVKARGSRQTDAAALLEDLASHWRAAHAREGKGLPWERRTALAASFTWALADGVARSARASLGSGARVAVGGTAFATPSAFRLVCERLRAAGLSPVVEPGVPLLDGAIPVGQILAAHRQPWARAPAV